MGIPVILKDGEVLYDVSPRKLNGLVTFNDQFSWITPYGVIIPLGAKSINFKTFLTEKIITIHDNSFIGLWLLDMDKLLKEILITKSGPIYNIIVNNIDINTPYIRGEYIEDEEIATALLVSGKSLEEIRDFYKENSNIITKNVRIHKLDKLYDLYNECISKKLKFQPSIFTNIDGN